MDTGLLNSIPICNAREQPDEHIRQNATEIQFWTDIAYKIQNCYKNRNTQSNIPLENPHIQIEHMHTSVHLGKFKFNSSDIKLILHKFLEPC